MREKFYEYYTPSKEEFDKMWAEGLFVFDTNVLLNIYKYRTETKEQLLGFLKRNELNNRIWLPYNVVYEFQERRLSIIDNQMNSYDKLADKLDKKHNEINNALDYYKEHRYLNINTLKVEIDRFFSQINKNIKNQKKTHPDWFEDDKILKEISEIFKEKIGDKFKPKELEIIYRDGQERYGNKIPPGYKDWERKKGQKYDIYDKREYGDLVIWKQIINKAKEVKQPIIFITEEEKEDWWFNEYRSKIGLRPRKELIKEIREEADVLFYMYTTKNFIEQAKHYFGIKINQNIIDEIDEISSNKITKVFNSFNLYKNMSKELRHEQKKIREDLKGLFQRREKLSEEYKDIKEQKDKIESELTLNISLQKRKTLKQTYNDLQNLIINNRAELEEILLEEELLKQDLSFIHKEMVDIIQKSSN